MTDLPMVYRISKREFYTSIWTTNGAINAHPQFDITFPTDAEEPKKTEVEFAMAYLRRYGPRYWRGQVGATDGIDTSQRNPGKVVKNPWRYHVQRRGGYKLLCIAICDVHARFIYYDTSHKARSYDPQA